jgi:hypothetical protein
MQRSEAFEALLDESQDYLTRCREALTAEFQIDRWPRWDWSQDTSQLIFSDAGLPKVIANIEFVGTISTKSDTWLWAWANDSLDLNVTQLIARVRTYGKTHGIDQLATDNWHAHEADGWEMTSIAAYLLNAKGAYRTPYDHGFLYMVITAVQWAA